MAGSLHGFENPEQGVPPVDRRERDEWRYQEEKGRVDAVGWAYSIVDCREDNLLDNSGDYTSLTLYISTVCNRIKLEISISDPDALLTVERHDVTADTWAEVLVIAAGTVKSPDFNGTGHINFTDTWKYLPELSAGIGICGNLSNDASGLVNFTDTTKYLPHLNGNHVCD